MRARIDVSEIEAQTKIRAKYLRALENEEWDLLPGPTFVRSFLRTYAQALGLDAKALVDEYRMSYEQPSELDHQPVMSPPRRAPTRASSKRQGPSRGYVIAVSAFSLLIVALIAALILHKEKAAESPPPSANSRNLYESRSTGRGGHVSKTSTTTAAGTNARVTLSLHPSAPVYVCLIDAAGSKRIPGLTLEPGSYTPRDYHSTRFELLLGNNAVKLYVDGKALSVPASSKPIGYSITSSGRHVLAASQQPTCK